MRRKSHPPLGRFMELLDKKTDKELVKSLLGEVAKAKNELKCADQDISKANNRLSFSIMAINKLLERFGDEE